MLDAHKLRGGAPVEEGVVRVSMLHYNTPHEVARLVAALREVLAVLAVQSNV